LDFVVHLICSGRMAAARRAADTSISNFTIIVVGIDVLFTGAPPGEVAFELVEDLKECVDQHN
jgi:hypothetical protein